MPEEAERKQSSFCAREAPQPHHARRLGCGFGPHHHSSAQPAEIPESGVGGDALPQDQRRAKPAADENRGPDFAGAPLSAPGSAGAGPGAAGHSLSTSDRFGQSKVTGIIILDNSYSMGVSDGTQTRFDKARQAAEQVLDSLPGGSATAVWLASDIVQDVIALPTFDLNLARKTIREAQLSDRATDLFPALDKAVEYLKGRMVVRKEIYLITDGQSAGWRQLTTDCKISLRRAKLKSKLT